MPQPELQDQREADRTIAVASLGNELRKAVNENDHEKFRPLATQLKNLYENQQYQEMQI